MPLLPHEHQHTSTQLFTSQEISILLASRRSPRNFLAILSNSSTMREPWVANHQRCETWLWGAFRLQIGLKKKKRCTGAQVHRVNTPREDSKSTKLPAAQPSAGLPHRSAQPQRPHRVCHPCSGSWSSTAVVEKLCGCNGTLSPSVSLPNKGPSPFWV